MIILQRDVAGTSGSTRAGLGSDDRKNDPGSYAVYRGTASELVDADGDGLPDDGYGACVNSMDARTWDNLFVVDEIPIRRATFFYLVAFVDARGQPSDLGTASDGLAREAIVPCP